MLKVKSPGNPIREVGVHGNPEKWMQTVQPQTQPQTAQPHRPIIKRATLRWSVGSVEKTPPFQTKPKSLVAIIASNGIKFELNSTDDT
jgi:hypothetical protein